MKTCRDAFDLLVEYLDGTLDAARTSHLEAHFRDCPPCLRFLSTYRKTVSLTRRLKEEQVPPEILDRVRRFLDQRDRP